MKRKELPGIVIFEEGLRTNSPEFEIIIANGTRKDDLFITSPLIRRLIKENRLSEGTCMGDIKIKISQGNLVFRKYYPLGEEEKYKQIFQGTETARYIESKILKKLKKYHKIKTVKNYDPQKPRLRQTTKLGYTEKQVIEQRLNFKTYLKKLTKKTAQLIRRTRRR